MSVVLALPFGLARAKRTPLGLLLVLVVDQFLVERQALVVERVAEQLGLLAQVGLVVRIWDRFDRELLGDR